MLSVVSGDGGYHDEGGWDIPRFDFLRKWVSYLGNRIGRYALYLPT